MFGGGGQYRGEAACSFLCETLVGQKRKQRELSYQVGPPSQQVNELASPPSVDENRECHGGFSTHPAISMHFHLRVHDVARGSPEIRNGSTPNRGRRQWNPVCFGRRISPGQQCTFIKGAKNIYFSVGMMPAPL